MGIDVTFVSPDASEEELNAPVDEVEGENIAFKSCDCRSECKYNTGHTHKYANYGYSD